jgi:hypothetical protein
MSNHHRNVQLPAFPRPYPVRRPSRPVTPERRQPLLWLVLLLQGLTLWLLVVGAFQVRQQRGEIPFASRHSLAALFSSQPIPAPMNTSTGEAPRTKGAPFQCAAGR